MNAHFLNLCDCFNNLDLKQNGVYDVQVKGKMTIHGVTKDIDAIGTIEVNDAKLIAKTSFMVLLADYEIDIPKIVFKNIAEEVEVTVELKYLPLKG